MELQKKRHLSSEGLRAIYNIMALKEMVTASRHKIIKPILHTI